MYENSNYLLSKNSELLIFDIFTPIKQSSTLIKAYRKISKVWRRLKLDFSLRIKYRRHFFYFHFFFFFATFTRGTYSAFYYPAITSCCCNSARAARKCNRRCSKKKVYSTFVIWFWPQNIGICQVIKSKKLTSFAS